MKKFLKGFIALSLGLAMVGCAKEYDDTALKSKVDELSSDVNTLKAQQKAMQAVIDVWKAGGYIASIDDSVPGQHTITFYGDNGKVVVLYDGEDGEQGPAGEDGDAYFKSIVTDENGVTFTLNDDEGTSFTIPFAKAFKLVINNLEAEVEAGKAVEFPYEIQNANATTTVDVFAGGNYVAAVNATESKIVVTPPTPAVNGSVLAWAQNEEGLFSMKKLSFIVKANTEVTTTQEELEAIPGEAGDFVVNVVSNIDIDVETPTVDWVSVAVTKADYKLTLTLAENTTDAPRETEIIVIRKDNGAQVQKIKIVQLVVDNTPMPDANPGDILWSEDWTVEKDGIMLDDYTFTGTKVFNDYKVKYSAVKPEDGSDIKVYLDTQMGGDTAQGNLLLSKKGGTWTISGIPSGNATQAVLTFKTNAKDRLDGVTSDTEGVTMGEMVAPTEKSKPYSYAYDITLAAGVTKFNLTFTCNNGSNVRLDDIVLKVPEAAEKVLTVERVWGKYSTSDSYWNAYFGGTASTDRNIAMDDEYIYLPETTGAAKMWKIPLDGTTNPSLVNVEGVTGGTHALSCVRVVPNTSSKVNGGKDFLMACNLTTNSESDALKVYSWNNGTSNAPVSESLTNGRGLRVGDKFSVYGSLQDGALFFRNWNGTDGWGGKGTILVLKMAWDDVPSGGYFNPRITFSYADGGINAYYPYPGDASNGFIASVSAAGQYASYANSPLNTNPNESGTFTAANGYYGSTAGYNFITFNGKRYIAYAKNAGDGDGRFYILQGETTDSWSDILGSKRNVIYQADIQQNLAYADGDIHEDLAEGVTKTSAHSALDCTARIIGGDLYFAVLKQGVGLSLFKMYLK